MTSHWPFIHSLFSRLVLSRSYRYICASLRFLKFLILIILLKLYTKLYTYFEKLREEIIHLFYFELSLATQKMKRNKKICKICSKAPALALCMERWLIPDQNPVILFWHLVWKQGHESLIFPFSVHNSISTGF